jgi:hypothetical protein
MANIKNTFFSSMVLIASFPVVAQQIPDSIIKSVSGLRIEKLSLDDKKLTFIYRDEKVSDLMALSVAQSICNTRFIGEPKFNNSLFNELVIYNHWKIQGFKFKLNGKICDEYGEKAGDESNLFLREQMTPL